MLADGGKSAPYQRHGALLVACVRVANVERDVANCLARLVPFVDAIVALDDGARDRSLAIAREYGAVIVPSVEQISQAAPTNGRPVWHCWFDLHVDWDQRDFEELRQLVAGQPLGIRALTLNLGEGRRAQPIHLDLRRPATNDIGNSKRLATSVGTP